MKSTLCLVCSLLLEVLFTAIDTRYVATGVWPALLRAAILQAAVLPSVVFVGQTLARSGDAECTPDVQGLQTCTEPVRVCQTPAPISGRTSICFLQVRRAPSGSANRPVDTHACSGAETGTAPLVF